MIFNKFFILFKIGRKIGKSNIINIVSETHKIPVFIKLFFNLLAFSFSSSNNTKSKGKENLSESIQEMGTTFIKLGQFLATRPDIIGEKLSKELESLQDKLPPFSKKEAEKIALAIKQMVTSLHLKYHKQDVNLTLSIGVAEHDHADELEQTIANADAALYLAKHSGRNRVCVYHSDLEIDEQHILKQLATPKEKSAAPRASVSPKVPSGI